MTWMCDGQRHPIDKFRFAFSRKKSRTQHRMFREIAADLVRGPVVVQRCDRELKQAELCEHGFTQMVLTPTSPCAALTAADARCRDGDGAEAGPLVGDGVAGVTTPRRERQLADDALHPRPNFGLELIEL